MLCVVGIGLPGVLDVLVALLRVLEALGLEGGQGGGVLDRGDEDVVGGLVEGLDVCLLGVSVESLGEGLVGGLELELDAQVELALANDGDKLVGVVVEFGEERALPLLGVPDGRVGVRRDAGRRRGAGVVGAHGGRCEALDRVGVAATVVVQSGCTTGTNTTN